MIFFSFGQTLFFKGRSPDDPACTVEGVVFGMRQNGFIVYVPCYALKGPVHLTEADTNQVWTLTQFLSVPFFAKKKIIGGQINDTLLGKYFYLPFLPATPNSLVSFTEP